MINNSLSPILVSAGDPNGIGYEILLKSFSPIFDQLLVIGNYTALKTYQDLLNIHIPVNKIEKTSQIQSGTLNLMDVSWQGEIEPGKRSASAGKLALESLLEAVACIKKGFSDVLITLPVNKKNIACHEAQFTGHTEFLASHFQTENFNMMLTNQALTVVLVTTHLPLAKVAEHISTEKVIQAIINTYQHLKKIGQENSTIAVSGLNPHAGENGHLGNEEALFIEPAVSYCQSLGIKVKGPFPADTMFVHFDQKPYGAYVCMYHDQGLVPLKMLGFGRSLNITLGLPFLRVSVDHGTAYDIAGKNLADPTNFQIAVDYALSYKPA